jgi:ABC-type multidrug transport system permease subunit
MARDLLHLSYYYYSRGLLYVAKVIATIMVAAAILGFVLIMFDLIYGLGWGYPWWSAFGVLGMIIVSVSVRYGVTIALRHVRRSKRSPDTVL